MNRTSMGVAFAVAAGLASAASAQGSPDWHWNPTQHVPAARWSFDWATDTLRSKLVLFGGGTVGTDDMWTFDGTDWLQLSPSPRPTARSLHSMAYDSARDRVVLFGGMGMIARRNDTWEWDGAAWLQRTPATAPPVRAAAAMVYDPVRQVTLLFGGEGDSGTRGDFWQWDGTAWTQLTPALLPPAVSGHEMVWDAVRQRVVLIAFQWPSFACDTWEWDGTAWLQRTPATVPPPRVDPAAAFDANRGVTVLYGGSVSGSASCRDDTWCWNGTNWVQDTTVHRPEGLAMHELAYLPSRKSVFVFGGATFEGTSQVASNELWMLNTLQFPADVASLGSGCASSAGVPVLEPLTLPWLTESFALELSSVPANKPWFLMLGTSSTHYWHLFLPAELSSFLMPGCWLYTEVFEAVPLMTGSGASSWATTIPNQSVLRGLKFYGQALVHDPLANVRGFVTSNAGAATIGSTL